MSEKLGLGERDGTATNDTVLNNTVGALPAAGSNVYVGMRECEIAKMRK